MAKSIINVGAAIIPIISTGISNVVIINDFLRTRSLNSRAMIIPILFIANLRFKFYNVPSTARINISFILGITSLNERNSTASFAAVMLSRTVAPSFSRMRVDV